MTYDTLKTKWWYRLIQVSFVILSIATLGFIELIIYTTNKPDSYLSNDSYIQCSTKEKKRYDLTHFPWSIRPGIDFIPFNFNEYAANLCHYQQFADTLQEKRDTLGYNEAYNYAYLSPKTDEGRVFFTEQIAQNGTSTVIDKMIEVYQVTESGYSQKEVIPDNYFTFNKKIAYTESYTLFVLYLFFGFVVTSTLLALIRGMFFYVIIGKFLLKWVK